MIQNIESADFKRINPPTSPIDVFKRGGIRIRLDPPQRGTPFNHMHLEYGGNSDIIKDALMETPCIWVIENWEYAKCTLGDEQKRDDLNKHIGIFSLILYMKYNNDKELEMHVLTVDDRYLTLFFKDPKLSLK